MIRPDGVPFACQIVALGSRDDGIAFDVVRFGLRDAASRQNVVAFALDGVPFGLREVRFHTNEVAIAADAASIDLRLSDSPTLRPPSVSPAPT
ncbi:MAG TPA: hypothetical protein VFH40_05055 [Gemmatimonadales bacterium]|nr:hypothetical protein [Gemmatimonadales bacterium]